MSTGTRKRDFGSLGVLVGPSLNEQRAAAQVAAALVAALRERDRRDAEVDLLRRRVRRARVAALTNRVQTPA